MSWSAIYVFGEARPVGWVDDETGVTHMRRHLGAKIPWPGEAAEALPRSLAPEDVEAWLAVDPAKVCSCHD